MYIIFRKVADQAIGSSIGKMLLGKRQVFVTTLLAFQWQQMVPMFSFPIQLIVDGG